MVTPRTDDTKSNVSRGKARKHVSSEQSIEGVYNQNMPMKVLPYIFGRECCSLISPQTTSIHKLSQSKLHFHNTPIEHRVGVDVGTVGYVKYIGCPGKIRCAIVAEDTLEAKTLITLPAGESSYVYIISKLN